LVVEDTRRTIREEGDSHLKRDPSLFFTPRDSREEPEKALHRIGGGLSLLLRGSLSSLLGSDTVSAVMQAHL
jgi:hypothetical protein